MVSAHPCPDWDYQKYPNYQRILTQDLATVIRALRLRALSVEVHGIDTRSVHHQAFSRLTPPGFPYFAGHYRGENLRCLIYNEVNVPMDPLVGVDPSLVTAAMASFGKELINAATVLDTVFGHPQVVTSEEQKLYAAVVVSARIFQEFLTVHPYVNGNGHMARFLVWLFLGRYNHFPRRWTIDPRPSATNYAYAISQHRRGDVLPLEQLILQSLV